jgi:hypothetical protein
MSKIFTIIKTKVSGIGSLIARKIDIRDILFILGLALSGYGFWLLKPWIGFVVTGFILIMASCLMAGDKE